MVGSGESLKIVHTKKSPVWLTVHTKAAWLKASAAAESLQSCPTLCDPIDSSPPGAPVPGILQARTLEWAAISFSNAWKWKVKSKSLSRVRLLATPWTAAYQAPLSMGFSRQEYGSGVPLPSPTEVTKQQQISITHAQNYKDSILLSHAKYFIKNINQYFYIGYMLKW